MSNGVLVWPMFAMVVLTAVVLVHLFRSRVRAVRSGAITTTYFRAFQGAVEPEHAALASRHFSNLFEAPTLFYVACLAAIVTHDTTMTAVMLAWAYVAARIVHTVVHLGGNRLKHRIRTYFGSWLILLAMWLHVVIHAASAPPA